MTADINGINAANQKYYTGDGARINVFWLSEDERGKLLLLGCPLDLTPRELGILRSVIRHYPNAVSVNSICGECLGLGAGSVPVHINSINKKSALIGGRRLVISQRKVGYILNKFM